MTMTASRILHRALPAWRPDPARLAAALRHGLELLVWMHRMAATRRMLAEADARTLADLGISPAQARFEASRRPWDWGRAEEAPPPPRLRR